MALLEANVPDNPLGLFRAWFEEAVRTGQPQANAMSLSTVDKSGQPSSRVVLLKGYDEKGFVFFTNYESRKAQDLEVNSKVSLLFFWPSMGRQIRVRGEVTKVSRQESEEYFRTRPRDSQLGAWASKQSTKLQTRFDLETKLVEMKKKFEGENVPCPPNWGGYRVWMSSIEFWEDRPNRLHDRLLYERQSSGWVMSRLSP